MSNLLGEPMMDFGPARYYWNHPSMICIHSFFRFYCDIRFADGDIHGVHLRTKYSTVHAPER